MSSFTVGQSLGRYRLDAVLARGGMAQVFRATDARLGRVVAVKVILAAYALEKEFVERFLREARLVAGLEHPNILPIYDFGEEIGVPYLVMPFIAGGTLAQRLEAAGGRPLPADSAAVWVDGLASALDAAHRAGVLHRDVKPGNVLVGGDERALLADFGIAKMHESATRLTTTGMVVGTPLYMAPELAKGGEASPASDGYALAVLAYEMVTGRAPFAGENALALLHQHVHTPPPRPTSQVSDLPAALDPVFERALAKTPEERYPSCRAFASALGVAFGTPVRPLAAPLSALPVSARTRALSDLETRQTRWSGGGWKIAAVVAALAVTGLAVWKFRGESGAAPSGEAKQIEVEPTAPAAGAASPAPRVEEATVEAAVTEAATIPETTPARPGGLSPRWPVAGPAAGSAPDPPAATSTIDSAADRAPGRLGVRRLTRVDFERLLAADKPLTAAGRRVPAERRAEIGAAAEIYARGGIAYVEGDLVAARQAIERLLPATEALPGTEPALVATVRAFTAAGGLEDWHVAIAYGDARREAAALLTTFEAAHPGAPSAAMGRAVLAAIDGDPRRAAALAEAAYRDRPSARLVAFIAQQHVAAGAGGDALRWFEIAAAGTGMEAGFAAMQAAKLARQLGQIAKAEELQARACQQGVRAACVERAPLRRQRP